MRLKLPFGECGTMEADLPEGNLAGVVGPNRVRASSNAIEESLSNPCGERSLESFLEGGKDVVVIVNDGTRPTPTAEVLEALDKRMDLECAHYLIATGTHRAPTEDELEFIFGRYLERLRHRIIVHDAWRSPCVHLGVSKNGTEMDVNKVAIDADRLIIITSVEPHYFAGYTGGRKSFLPGVAAFHTIEQNHKLAMLPRAKTLVLKGNPVHQDMMDALSVVKEEIFSVQVVLDQHQKVYRAVSGDLNLAFRKAVRWANRVYLVDVPKRYDAVISVVKYPMDVDLYQSQKAIDNAKWALKDGGTLIMVSRCREGVGGETFVDLLTSSKDKTAMLKSLQNEYKLGYHKAAKMAELMCRANIWAVTDLPSMLLEGMGIRSFGTLQGALDALLTKNPKAEVLVLMDGSVTVPRVLYDE